MGKHNVNELLERKKELESQIEEKGVIDATSLEFREEVTIDHINTKNTRSFAPRAKATLVDYTQVFNGLTKELAKVKTAIQKYNADKVLGKLHERESVRSRIHNLKNIKANLRRETSRASKVTRQDNTGATLETLEVTVEPLFDIKDVEIQMNNLSAQERKLNTEIQKLNLDASIEV